MAKDDALRVFVLVPQIVSRRIASFGAIAILRDCSVRLASVSSWPAGSSSSRCGPSGRSRDDGNGAPRASRIAQLD
eukprot:674719-Amphidinium_carterae.1